MFSLNEFEKTKQTLSHVGGSEYSAELGQHHLTIRPTTLLDWMEFLKDDLGFFSMTEIVAHDQSEGHDFEIVYHLLNMGSHQRLNLHLLANRGEIVPSVTKFFSEAGWMEREQSEMLGLSFDVAQLPLFLPAGQKNFPLSSKAKNLPWAQTKESVPPTLRYNPNKSETAYPEESYQWKVFDILKPQTLGNFELSVCFDPIKVVDSKVNVGFYHQGFEGLLKHKDIFQITHLVDKINLNASPSYSIAWAKTIEELYKIKIPERAQAIRIVMLELARIADHLAVLASICIEASQSEFQLFINAREKVNELFEKFSGSRHAIGPCQIGGVKDDLPYGWIIEYQNVADVLLKNLRLIHNSLVSQLKFRKMLDGDPVNAQLILEWGVTGPAMRAAGLNFDLRKSQPFYFYQDVDFDIPVGIHGSGYDRYLIRMEEIFQSLRITTQVIDNLPLGDVMSQEFNQNHTELCRLFEGMDKVLKWHFSSLEGPSGELGFLVKFNHGLRPERIKFKTPGFSLAQALPIFIKSLSEEQISTNLASLGLSRWEMDR